MIHVQLLVWNEWNIEHIARHKVIPEEVEAVCQSAMVASETYAGRIRVIGTTAAGRELTVILAPRGEDVYYPITARPASRKERRLLSEAKGPE
jgi:uncharacterized protein